MNNNSGKREQLQKIKSGNGIQHILDEAYSILGNPMLVFDMEYKLVAHTDDKNDDPIWNEFIENGGLSQKTIGFIANEGFIDIAANGNGRPYLLVSEYLQYNRIIGQIYNKKNEAVVDLAVVACNKPFEDDALSDIGIIYDKLSKEIEDDSFFQNCGQAYIENMIIRLIEDDFDDKSLYSDHIANVYKGLKNYIYVAVADLSQHGAAGNLHYFKDIMRQKRPDFKYTIYHNQIIILFSSQTKTFRGKNGLKDFSDLFEQENIYAGISTSFENLYILKRYYKEAVQALKNGLENGKGNQRFFPHGEVAL